MGLFYIIYNYLKAVILSGLVHNNVYCLEVVLIIAQSSAVLLYLRAVVKYICGYLILSLKYNFCVILVLKLSKCTQIR